MDTILVPLSETPDRWAVETHPGPTRLGMVEREATGLFVRAAPDSHLAGIDPGPYPSREAVQSAVQQQLGGTCELFKFEKPASPMAGDAP
jgi:hypothetical protein